MSNIERIKEIIRGLDSDIRMKVMSCDEKARWQEIKEILEEVVRNAGR
jgi:hypothetical protein